MTTIAPRDAQVSEACRESTTRDEREAIIAAYRQECATADLSLLDRTMRENDEIRAELDGTRRDHAEALTALVAKDARIAELEALVLPVRDGSIWEKSFDKARERIAELERSNKNTADAYLRQLSRADLAEAHVARLEAANKPLSKLEYGKDKHGWFQIAADGCRHDWDDPEARLAQLESDYAEERAEHQATAAVLADLRCRYCIEGDYREDGEPAVMVMVDRLDNTIKRQVYQLDSLNASLKTHQQLLTEANADRDGYKGRWEFACEMVEGQKQVIGRLRAELSQRTLVAKPATRRLTDEDTQNAIAAMKNAEPELLALRSSRSMHSLARASLESVFADGVPARETVEASAWRSVAADNAKLISERDERISELESRNAFQKSQREAFGVEVRQGLERIAELEAELAAANARYERTASRCERTAAECLREAARADLAASKIAVLEAANRKFRDDCIAQLAHRPPAAPVTDAGDLSMLVHQLCEGHETAYNLADFRTYASRTINAFLAKRGPAQAPEKPADWDPFGPDSQIPADVLADCATERGLAPRPVEVTAPQVETSELDGIASRAAFLRCKHDEGASTADDIEELMHMLDKALRLTAPPPPATVEPLSEEVRDAVELIRSVLRDDPKAPNNVIVAFFDKRFPKPAPVAKPARTADELCDESFGTPDEHADLDAKIRAVVRSMLAEQKGGGNG